MPFLDVYLHLEPNCVHASFLVSTKCYLYVSVICVCLKCIHAACVPVTSRMSHFAIQGNFLEATNPNSFEDNSTSSPQGWLSVSRWSFCFPNVTNHSINNSLVTFLDCHENTYRGDRTRIFGQNQLDLYLIFWCRMQSPIDAHLFFYRKKVGFFETRRREDELFRLQWLVDLTINTRIKKSMIYAFDVFDY